MLTRLFYTSLLTLLCITPSWSATPKMLIQRGKWAAYEFKEGKQKVCYMVSRPLKEVGNYNKRGKVYAMITHRPPESFNVVSFYQGYSFSPGATAIVQIGKTKFDLFTEDKTAWASNDQDGPIVDAIKKGETIIVKGQTSKGANTTDVYSLKGSSDVYKAMSKACGGVR